MIVVATQPVMSGDRLYRRAMAFEIGGSIQEKRAQMAAIVAANAAALQAALDPLQFELDALEVEQATLFPPAQRLVQWQAVDSALSSGQAVRVYLHHTNARLTVVRDIATQTSDDSTSSSADGDESMSA